MGVTQPRSGPATLSVPAIFFGWTLHRGGSRGNNLPIVIYLRAEMPSIGLIASARL